MGKHIVKPHPDAYRRLQEYVRERDAAVLCAVRDGNLAPMKALARQNGQKIPADKVLLISAHKCCCAITTMPKELQEKSRKWLKEHGYKEGIW